MNIPLFIPIALWGLAAAATATATYFGGRAIFKRKNRTKLGVLGMQAAGKTRFLSFLRNIPFIEKSTDKEEYKSFTYRHNKKAIRIDTGIDIGGGSIYKDDYISIIKNSDVVFYFFDISKYLNNEIKSGEFNYKRECNSRFELVFSESKKLEIPTVFIGTHSDQCLKDQKVIRKEFLNLLKNKSYYSSLKDVVIINLTNTKQLENFIDKVFSK
ncbi:GTPase domain-containing protein [Algibacter sp. 2305UL17-15]|uniref:GTPase domain-containing protein n=1 Tax=Algibacter sp. 2305UL17-15 TaxID=3231268 RepID=UPI00345AE79F